MIKQEYSIWEQNGSYTIHQTLAGAFATKWNHIKKLDSKHWNNAVEEFAEFLLENNIDESKVIL
jgi:hypothetical protein